MDFYSYGGPGIKYSGIGKLPPMIKDIIVHYFHLLGMNPNEGIDIPDGYQPKNLDNLSCIPPPDDFVYPGWSKLHRQVEMEDALVDAQETPGTEDSHEPIILRIPKSRYTKRTRSPSPSLEPQASSTLRSEDDAPERSPIVMRLSKQIILSKPAKKSSRLSSSLGERCDYCGEKVTVIDIKSKNYLVKCDTHKVHKYCQKDCLEAHAGMRLLIYYFSYFIFSL